MWLVPLALSQVFLWSGHAYYRAIDAPRTWGWPLADQRAGGGVMLIEGSFVMLGVAVAAARVPRERVAAGSSTRVSQRSGARSALRTLVSGTGVPRRRG